MTSYKTIIIKLLKVLKKLVFLVEEDSHANVTSIVQNALIANIPSIWSSFDSRYFYL